MQLKDLADFCSQHAEVEQLPRNNSALETYFSETYFSICPPPPPKAAQSMLSFINAANGLRKYTKGDRCFGGNAVSEIGTTTGQKMMEINYLKIIVLLMPTFLLHEL